MGVSPKTDVLIRRGSFGHRHTNTHPHKELLVTVERERLPGNTEDCQQT